MTFNGLLQQCRYLLLPAILLCVVQTQSWGQIGINRSPTKSVQKGTHGGTLRQVGDIQTETIVSDSGATVYLSRQNGDTIDVAQYRGVALIRIEGRPKRYRYDLVSVDQKKLVAFVDLSQWTGREATVDIQIVEAGKDRSQRLVYQEIASIPISERQLLESAIATQKTCPVTGQPLGSMGDPVAVEVAGERLFVCCAACVPKVEADPNKYLSKPLTVEVVQVSLSDQPLIAKQANCPVMDIPLDSMGGPVKLLVGDKPLFLCCEGCLKKVQSDPAKYLATVYEEGEVGVEDMP